MTKSADAEVRWLKNADHWKQFERFDEITGEREEIYLLKSAASPEARFYAVGKGQVGPRHKHVMAATCWAYGNGYLGVCEDPRDIFIEIACRAEVMAGGVASGANGS